MMYHLRRLRLHGMIERIAHTHRYRLTVLGRRAALFFTRTYDHLLRAGLETYPTAFEVPQRFTQLV